MHRDDDATDAAEASTRTLTEPDAGPATDVREPEVDHDGERAGGDAGQDQPPHDEPHSSLEQGPGERTEEPSKANPSNGRRPPPPMTVGD